MDIRKTGWNLVVEYVVAFGEVREGRQSFPYKQRAMSAYRHFAQAAETVSVTLYYGAERRLRSVKGSDGKMTEEIGKPATVRIVPEFEEPEQVTPLTPREVAQKKLEEARSRQMEQLKERLKR